MTPSFIEWTGTVGITHEWSSGAEAMWVGNICDTSRPFREPTLAFVRVRPDEITLVCKGRRAFVFEQDQAIAFWLAPDDETRKVRTLVYDNPASREQLRAYLVEGRLQ